MQSVKSRAAQRTVNWLSSAGKVQQRYHLRKTEIRAARGRVLRDALPCRTPKRREKPRFPISGTEALSRSTLANKGGAGTHLCAGQPAFNKAAIVLHTWVVLLPSTARSGLFFTTSSESRSILDKLRISIIAPDDLISLVPSLRVPKCTREVKEKLSVPFASHKKQ